MRRGRQANSHFPPGAGPKRGREYFAGTALGVLRTKYSRPLFPGQPAALPTPCRKDEARETTPATHDPCARQYCRNLFYKQGLPINYPRGHSQGERFEGRGVGGAPAGLLESDDADTDNDPLPAGVDNAVVKIGRDYDDVGRLRTITSYDADNEVVNETKVVFDGWGNVWKSYQDHASTADVNDPAVTYTYDDTNTGDPAAVPYVRLQKITLPGASREVYYNYGTAGGTNDVLSRLDNLAASGGSPVYAAYTYLGASTIVQVAHPAVTGGLALTYGTGGTYGGFDRFGRIVWQKWSVGSTVVDRYFYGYDRNSNRLWRADRPTDIGVPGRDEAYAYDALDRLVGAKRGTQTPMPIRNPLKLRGFSTARHVPRRNTVSIVCRSGCKTPSGRAGFGLSLSSGYLCP